MVIPMTARVLEALRAIPRWLGVEWVFLSTVPPKEVEQPKSWNDIGWMFHRAATKAGLPDLWFHDLRRSFVTRARRNGIPESVVMQAVGAITRTHATFTATTSCRRTTPTRRSSCSNRPPDRKSEGHPRETHPRSRFPEQESLSSQTLERLRDSGLRGQDLNLRPSGYEPDELPGCSTPRQSLAL